MMITIMILLVTTIIIIIIINNADDKTMNTSIIMLPFQSPKISIEIPSLSHSIECIMLLTTVLLNNFNSIQIHLNPFTWSTCQRTFLSLCLRRDCNLCIRLSFFVFCSSKVSLCATDSSSFLFNVLHSSASCTLALNFSEFHWGKPG